MIFRPSGGALYHWRAFRRRHAWREFNAEIADWLAGWNPPREHLLLIGPSGGYTLPTEWLKSFKRIDAYDLDPLAAFFFRRGHAGVTAYFHKQDLFWQGGRLSTEPLRALLNAHPGASVLFSNVLGQLLVERKVSEGLWLSFLTELRKALQGRTWASYHDTFTHESDEVIDHLLAGDWKKGLSSREFRWPLTDESLHVIEGVLSSTARVSEL